MLAACADPLDHRGIDLAWEFREDFGDLEAGVRFKFLTVYQRDFRRHHTLVYGEKLLEELPQVSFQTALPSRVDRIEQLARDHATDAETIRMLAGETARLRARVDGADSLCKEDVLSTLRRHDRTEALRVYEAYVHGDPESLPPERLRGFIRSAVARLRAGRPNGETSS